MITIGITGGIGSGKSLVCSYLKEKYGACVLMADDIGHEVMEPGGCAYDAVLRLFGKEYVKEDRTFDRKKIGDQVFKQPELLEQLNGIIHPAVHQTILERAKEAEKNGCAVCVVEAALLIEADYRDICQEYWYVHVPEEIRKERLLASRDITPEKIDDIIRRQLPEEKFRSACEFILENGADFEKTMTLADERIAQLKEKT